MFKISSRKLGYADCVTLAQGQTFALFGVPQEFELRADTVPEPLRVLFTAVRDKEKKPFELNQTFAGNKLEIVFCNPSEGGLSGATGPMGTVKIDKKHLLFSFQTAVLPQSLNYILFYQFDELTALGEIPVKEAP